ncbi:MAG: SPFH domain-containing protein, partial [Clostridia bacterium]|nr:SPFH domain-containing protein [Clostridia bacterium]
MGLIKAITGAAGGVLADQWKEYFYCDSIANDILIVKGQKRVSGRSSNTKAEDNIISNGSGIAVADGQCMIIVEQGKVVELCAEPGQFTWNSSTEPSIFAGSLGESILETFKAIGKRFTYGGDTGKDQRVYYFNTKEILDNKFGTANPIAFRVVDSRINFDVDVSLRCNGTYTFRVTDPIKLYTNVTGNVVNSYSKDELRDTMKTEFISALGPALAKLSVLEIRPNQIPAHTNDLEKYLNEELSAEWGARGIGDVKVAINPPTLTEEDQEMLKTAQKTAMYRDPTMAAAT